VGIERIEPVEPLNILNIMALPDRGEVVLYRTEDGRTALDVRLAGETVWLTLNQMSDLFARDKSVISRHLHNVFKSKELSRKATVAKNATVQIEGGRKITREVEYYNLDAIISVGYRVNSKRGTQFRIWATRTLKDHIIRGYTLNERRLREKGLTEAEQAIQLLSRTLTRHNLVNEEGRGVLEVISRYAKSWLLLKEYDEERLAVPEKRRPARITIDYSRARKAIEALKARLTERGEATPLFGQERNDQLAGIVGSIEQTFDGTPLYPSIEEKAAHLLYFVIKDHPFADGNKRIGSFLFIVFLRENGYLEDASGQTKINDNALVALALLIAESEPRNKELMIRLVMNLLVEGKDSSG
jgi:prophage maintenance system killer protein